MDLPIYIGSVPTEHLDDMPSKLRAAIDKIASDGVDLPRMGMVINRDQRQVYKLFWIAVTVIFIRLFSFAASLKAQKAIPSQAPSSQTSFWVRKMGRVCLLRWMK